MEQVSNPFQACKDIFLKPNRVFATLATTDNWSWIAFAVVMLLSLAPIYLYFTIVDFAWYTDTIIETSYANTSPAEQDFARSWMTKDSTLWISLILTALGTLVVHSIIAVYLHFATRNDDTNIQGFTDWFGLTWWVSLPLVFGSLLSIILILTSTSEQLPQDILAPLSVTYWANVSLASPWYSFLQTLRLDAFWSMYLIAVGVSQWTQMSTRHCYLIAVLPYLLVWTLWALLIAT